MQDFETKVLNWIEDKALVTDGELLLLGVSGGADSVALLRFFCQVKQHLGIALACIHIEHGIRGLESKQDAFFVENLCQTLGVECKVVSVGHQIEALDDTHMSLEEKARLIRYQEMEAYAAYLEKERGKRVRIAVAHHENDNVETVLFHLARGTGIDGLKGMPMQRGRIIRPFLNVERQEIESYLELLGQEYCKDATNQDIAYDRNRIRHQIMPQLCQVNSQAITHMHQTALLMGEVADYVNGEAQKILEQAEMISEEPGAWGELAIEALRPLPSFLQGEVIHLWMQKYIPGAKDIGQTHIGAVMELLESQVGRRCYLPGEICVWRTYQGLAMGQDQENAEEKQEEVTIKKTILDREGQVKLHYQDKIVWLRKMDRDPTQDFPKSLYTKWFDYDKIKSDIQMRHRKPGDEIIVTAAGNHKMLRDYFVNEKISARLRDSIPLLCDGAQVIWVVGHRISEYYKIDNNTKHILEVHFLEEKYHE